MGGSPGDRRTGRVFLVQGLRDFGKKMLGCARQRPTGDQEFGLGRRPGDAHYRAYVGPPEDYDLLAGIQFSLLFAAGLRETHTVLDVGCGSLRAGRLLIPYLRPGHYFGIEPERWLVDAGIAHELGRDALRLKRPSFMYRDDFAAGDFGVEFDFAIAQSVFSHTFPDMAVTGLARIAAVLAPRGLLVATFHGRGAAPKGSGWLYPQCVAYQWEEMAALLSTAGLRGRTMTWPHPRQTWFLAAKPEAEAHLDAVVRLVARTG